MMNERDIFNEYQSGVSLGELARKNNSDTHRIWRILLSFGRQEGIELRKKLSPPNEKAVRNDEMFDQFVHGKRTKELSIIYNLAPQTVSEIIRRIAAKRKESIT